ncbi:sodium-dependent transporter [Thermococcus sp.]
MEERTKWTIYLTFLVAGFATGIGTMGLFPQFWLQYGITGLTVYLVFTLFFTYLAILEAESTQRTAYHFVELYTKLTRTSGMIIAILLAIVVFLSYYTANTALILLSPFLGTGALGRLIAKLILLAVTFIIITRAKEKTFLIMAGGSALFVIFAVITAVAFKTKIPAENFYLDLVKGMIFARQPLSLALLRDAAIRALYGVGLGFAFYLMIGSFMGRNFSSKVIIGTGVAIQVFIGIIATFTVIYSVAPGTPGLLLTYATGGEEGSIKFMEALPHVLANYQILLLMIAMSLFFAGLTSIVPTAEIGLQITQMLTGLSREKAATYFISFVVLLGIIDSYPPIADMMLQAINVFIFIGAIFEIYPILTKLRGQKSPIEHAIATVGAVVFALLGIYVMISEISIGGYRVVSTVIAIVLLIIGIAIREFGKASK